MSRREVTQYYDDLDNSLITEDELEVIRFSVGGKNYLLDLSKENAKKFHELLEPYVAVARPAPENDKVRTNPGEIRTWAREQGITIAHRGKIPHNIIAAYNEAHA